VSARPPAPSPGAPWNWLARPSAASLMRMRRHARWPSWPPWGGASHQDAGAPRQQVTLLLEVSSVRWTPRTQSPSCCDRAASCSGPPARQSCASTRRRRASATQDLVLLLSTPGLSRSADRSGRAHETRDARPRGRRATPEKPSLALTSASSMVRPAAAASSAHTRCMTGPSSVTLNVPAAADTSCVGRRPLELEVRRCAGRSAPYVADGRKPCGTGARVAGSADQAE